MYHIGEIPLGNLGIQGRITLEVTFSVSEDEGRRFLKKNNDEFIAECPSSHSGN
jgi:hypothetical protein